MGKGGAGKLRGPAPARHHHVHGKKKQAVIQNAQELRRAKKHLQQHSGEAGPSAPDDAMVQRRVLLSCVDRIRSLLPKMDKPTPSSSSGQQHGMPRQDRSRDRSADIMRLLPFQPLKRHVLWMTPKEQDASSTLTLTQELEAFADYVSLDPVEDQARQGLLDDVRDAISSKLSRGARMRAFGSYPAGLSVYMSDVDVSIHGLGVGDDSDDEGKPSAPTPTGHRGIETAPAVEEEEEEVVDVVWSLDTGADGALAMAAGKTNAGKKRPRDDDKPVVVAVDAYSSEEEAENGGKEESPALEEDIDVSSNLGTGPAPRTQKKGAPVSSSAEDDARRLRVLEVLRSLFAHLKQLHWVAEIELRKFARVPIICLVHRNGLQCDISVGVKTGDTSRQVAAMQAMAPAPPPASSSSASPFYALCAFLKVFLAGLGLDKPFTGGIGSYKLYVMVAFVLDRQRRQPASSSTLKKIVVGDGQDFRGSNSNVDVDLGALLLAFFQYFGDARHLNADTVLRLVAPVAPSVKVEASFAGATQVRACQRAFFAAHKTLADDLCGCEGGVRSLAWLRPPPAADTNGTVSSNNSSSGGSNNSNSNSSGSSIGSKKSKGFSFAGASGAIGDLSRYSRSLLARLVDADRLSRERSALSSRCARYPPLPEEQREAVAASVLAELNARLQNSAREVSMDELRRTDPALVCRLRSFRSVEEALRRARHEGGGGNRDRDRDLDRDRGGAPPQKRQRSSNPYPQGVVGRVIASLVNDQRNSSRNSSGKSSNHSNHPNRGGGNVQKRQVVTSSSKPGLFTIKGLAASPRTKEGQTSGKGNSNGPRKRAK